MSAARSTMPLIIVGVILATAEGNDYTITCATVDAPKEQGGGVYCTFPNGDNAKQACEFPENEGTENCVLDRAPAK
jgi:hypothetical protein